MTITPTLRETLSWILIMLAAIEMTLVVALPLEIVLHGALAAAGRLLLAMMVGFSLPLVAIVACVRVAVLTPDPLEAGRE